ncbi:MAG TPA: hypothetical protein PLJ37_00975 [Chitinophagales bacterium]|nr:hypothetical protein [Chitinophagales bacterium]HMW93400.1 hypothetical protein [Chitinophagales bacterium]HMZ92978.1 hypothetical protein [Chitinophagales bacterium]HNG25959.1 hypothetical protein [Chitinophagales bacterium]
MEIKFMQQFNVDSFKNHVPKVNSNSNDFKWFNLKDGSNFIKVLPPWGESANGLPWYEVIVHYIKDPEGRTHTFRCARDRMKEQFCAFCDRSQALKNSKNETDKALSTSIRAQVKFLYNLLGDKDEMFVYSAPKTVYLGIHAQLKAYVDENMNPLDPDQTIVINIDKSGTGINTKYQIVTQPKRFSIPRAIREAKLIQLDNVYPVFTNDDLKKVLEGDFSVKNKKDAELSFNPKDFDNASKSLETSAIVNNNNNSNDDNLKSAKARELLGKLNQ